MGHLPHAILVLAFFLCTICQIHCSTYNQNGGQYYAIIANGDINDFGWNANINQGRVKMEAALNMSGILFVTNIPDNVTGIATGIDLVQRGFRVIIYSNFVYGNAPTVLATRYPNVTFAQYGVKSSLPNLSDLVFSSIEFYFAIGVFCGATSNNGKVGFVYPGASVSPINAINGFYSGMKFANPDAEMYMVTIDTFEDPDREQGAVEILLGQNVGALVGQTNDLVVPNAAMNAGLLSVGVTGYSLRQIYGEQVGASFVHDWSPALIPLAAGVNGTVVKKDYSGNFKGGAQQLDTPSHFVTSDQWALVNKGVNLIKNGTLQYNCGPYMAQFGGLNALGCLVNGTSAIGIFLARDIHDLGTYHVPIEDIKFPQRAATGLFVTSIVLMGMTLVLGILIIILRNREEIRTGSPIFFMAILGGALLVFGGVLVWSLDPSKSACLARIWLPSIGGTLAISALVTKNVRILLIFKYPMKFRNILSVKYYLPGIVVLIALDAMLLGIYTGIGPKGVQVQQGTHDLTKYQTRHVCATSNHGNSLIYAILVYHGAQLLAGCWVSYSCRVITDPAWDERKAVAFCLYGVAFCLIVFTVLVGIIGLNNDQLVVGVAVALLLVTIFSLVAIFGSRLVDIYGAPIETIVAMYKRTVYGNATSETKGGSASGGSARSKGSSSKASSKGSSSDSPNPSRQASSAALNSSSALNSSTTALNAPANDVVTV